MSHARHIHRAATLFFGLVVALVVAASAPSAHAQADAWVMVADANQALEDWDNATADELIQSLEALYPDSAAAHYIRGKWLFHEGRYPEALEHLDAALAGARGARPGPSPHLARPGGVDPGGRGRLRDLHERGWAL